MPTPVTAIVIRTPLHIRKGTETESVSYNKFYKCIIRIDTKPKCSTYLVSRHCHPRNLVFRHDVFFHRCNIHHHISIYACLYNFCMRYCHSLNWIVVVYIQPSSKMTNFQALDIFHALNHPTIDILCRTTHSLLQYVVQGVYKLKIFEQIIN